MKFNYRSIPRDKLAMLDQFAAMACSTKQGIQHTYLAALDIAERGVPGEVVECGVAYGAQICSMAEALRGQSRTFHLFDSFVGIPMAGIHDHDQPGIGKHVVDPNLPIEQRLVSSGISASSVENVKRNLAKFNFDANFLYHPGWFQDTVGAVETGPIAILRLDGDLYESTKVCLENLFFRIVSGGCLILDDYPLPGSRKALDDFFRDMGIDLKPVIECDTGAAYFRI